MSKIIFILTIVLISLIFFPHHGLLLSNEEETRGQLKPPWELRKLSAVLYEFLNAPNREEFARTHHIFYHDGKLRVYIDMAPGISKEEKDRLIGTYRINIEKGSGNRLRAILPADELASLAKETPVLSIRLPDRPQAQEESEIKEGEVKK